MLNLFEQPWFPWALAIAISLPLLTLLLGEVVVHLQRRGNALAGPLSVLRVYILPASAVILLLTRVAQVSPNGAVIKVLLTIFWMAVIIAVLSLLNALLFSDATGRSWRSRLPRIFIDLGRLVLIALGAALVLALVWDRNPSGLITAIGLSSLVIGLTLQNSVGPIIAGLFLLFERPFEQGDWLKVGDVIGEVVEVNWRATHLATGNQLQIIPNGMLASASFANYSRPASTHDETVTLSFTLKDVPNTVRDMLLDVARQLPSLAPGTTPRILVSSIEGDSIAYAVTFGVLRQEDGPRARDEFLTRAYYATRRQGLTLVGLAPYLAPDTDRIGSALRRIAPLLRVSEADVERLLADARVQQFARGETLQRQGGASTGLHFLLTGRASAFVDDPVRGRLNVLELAPGDYYGEVALTGEPNPVTITALTDVEELVLDTEPLQALIDQIPRLAQDLGETMEQRRRLLRTLQGSSSRLRRASTDGYSANALRR